MLNIGGHKITFVDRRVSFKLYCIVGWSETIQTNELYYIPLNIFPQFLRILQNRLCFNSWKERPETPHMSLDDIRCRSF